MSDLVRVTEAPPRDMIALRGDLAALAPVVTELTGGDLPGPLSITFGPRGAVGWMSPDELLVVLPEGKAAEALTRLAAALDGQHHLALDVSDMRAVFSVDGTAAREILAKLVPVDMSPAAFVSGHFRRTHVGQVAGGVWAEAADRFTVICFRSVGDYMRALLEQSARDGVPGIWPAQSFEP